MSCLPLQIMFDKSSPQGIMDVLSGEADAALGRADILSDMQYAGQINASDLKCVTAVSLKSLLYCSFHCLEHAVCS